MTSIQSSASAFDSAKHVTVIADRESDIDAFLATAPDAQTDVLIRACQDRCVDDDDDIEHLFASLEASRVVETYELEIVSTPIRQTRTALLEVRFPQVSIRRPARASRTLPETSLWAVETRERPETFPPQEKPIQWPLLTTHPVRQRSQTPQVIRWYQPRGLIEERFRVLKKPGFNIEASQLGNGNALWTLVMFAMFRN